jgi:hypothetical protein
MVSQRFNAVLRSADSGTSPLPAEDKPCCIVFLNLPQAVYHHQRRDCPAVLSVESFYRRVSVTGRHRTSRRLAGCVAGASALRPGRFPQRVPAAAHHLAEVSYPVSTCLQGVRLNKLTCQLLYYTTVILAHRPFWSVATYYAVCAGAARAIETLVLLLEVTFGLDITSLMGYCIYTGESVVLEDTQSQRCRQIRLQINHFNQTKPTQFNSNKSSDQPNQIQKINICKYLIALRRRKKWLFRLRAPGSKVLLRASASR